MSKGNYTHIKELQPTIQAMIAEGMSQREIAEYFGFKSKKVVHDALTRGRRKENSSSLKSGGVSQLRRCRNTRQRTND